MTYHIASKTPEDIVLHSKRSIPSALNSRSATTTVGGSTACSAATRNNELVRNAAMNLGMEMEDSPRASRFTGTSGMIAHMHDIILV